MRESATESAYLKIHALISRNDFATAEKLMQKNSAALTEAQEKELRDWLVKRRRGTQKEARKRAGRLRSGRRRQAVWALSRGLFACWLILGLILYPFSELRQLQRLLSMNMLFLLELIITAILLALQFLEARRDRMAHQEAKRRAEKTDENAFRLYQAMEKDDCGREKGWLLALLFSVLYMLCQVIYLIKTY